MSDTHTNMPRRLSSRISDILQADVNNDNEVVEPESQTGGLAYLQSQGYDINSLTEEQKQYYDYFYDPRNAAPQQAEDGSKVSPWDQVKYRVMSHNKSNTTAPESESTHDNGDEVESSVANHISPNAETANDDVNADLNAEVVTTAGGLEYLQSQGYDINSLTEEQKAYYDHFYVPRKPSQEEQAAALTLWENIRSRVMPPDINQGNIPDDTFQRIVRTNSADGLDVRNYADKLEVSHSNEVLANAEQPPQDVYAGGLEYLQSQGYDINSLTEEERKYYDHFYAPRDNNAQEDQQPTASSSWGKIRSRALSRRKSDKVDIEPSLIHSAELTTASDENKYDLFGKCAKFKSATNTVVAANRFNRKPQNKDNYHRNAVDLSAIEDIEAAEALGPNRFARGLAKFKAATNKIMSRYYKKDDAGSKTAPENFNEMLENEEDSGGQSNFSRGLARFKAAANKVRFGGYQKDETVEPKPNGYLSKFKAATKKVVTTNRFKPPGGLLGGLDYLQSQGFDVESLNDVQKEYYDYTYAPGNVSQEDQDAKEEEVNANEELGLDVSSSMKNFESERLVLQPEKEAIISTEDLPDISPEEISRHVSLKDDEIESIIEGKQIQTYTDPQTGQVYEARYAWDEDSQQYILGWQAIL